LSNVPWTGEGIYHALVSGRAAGAALAARGGLADRRACLLHAQQVRLRQLPALALGQAMLRAARTPAWDLLTRLLAVEPVRRTAERAYARIPLDRVLV
jgi:flavin-dependent dehydrogenase